MIETDDSYYPVNNLLEGQLLTTRVEQLKKEGKKVGLVSGSFDLLHPGHMTHLSSAKKLCDVLVVALAIDEWSKELKSRTGRPIFSQRVRAYALSQIRSVDFIVYNDNEFNIIDKLKPDFYIKGKDYLGVKDPRLEPVKKFLSERSIQILFTDDEKLSTTQIIDYIKEIVA